MQYRKLGNTGLEVSALGFGCMRLPKLPDQPSKVDQDASVALFRRAVEVGVNYFDSAYIYDNGDSERTLGRFLKEADREQVIVVSKNPVGHQWWPIPGDKPTGPLWRECLEEQLGRLDTPYMDACLFHDTALLTFRIIINAPGGPLEQAKKAKEQGLIRHIGISSHDSADKIIKILEMGKGAIELMVIQYNLLDRANEKAIEYAREHGVGVALMGPIGGGRLIHPSPVYQEALGASSTAEAALRFVLANPGVSTALSGMNAMDQLEENVATVSRAEPLSAEECERIDRLQKENEKLLGLYCTGCGYCMPCPNGVNIPANFTALNLLKVHGIEALARKNYDGLGDGRAERCVQCSECAGKCPQDIDIGKRLAETAEALG